MYYYIVILLVSLLSIAHVEANDSLCEKNVIEIIDDNQPTTSPSALDKEEGVDNEEGIGSRDEEASDEDNGSIPTTETEMNPLSISSADQQLINATLSQDMALVKDALDKKANVNVIAESGVSPLHIAANTNNVDIAKLLIDNGAEVNIEDSNGYTPLDYALSCHHDTMIHFLKSIGAKAQL